MTGEAALLAKAGWSDAGHEDIPSDASDRRYVRLRKAGGETAILMRAPVAASAPARAQFEAFRRIGAWLLSLGLSAPREIAVDAGAGLILMEDLGAGTLARLLDLGGDDPRAAYGLAADVLARVAAAAPPGGLARPGARDLADMTAPLFDELGQAGSLREDLTGALADALRDMSGDAVVSLRDVHADNLVWRAGQMGLARIGLLDYQDALLLPDGYDLASLLDDPRREVPGDWRPGMIAGYAARRGRDAAEMAARVDLLSVQRNLRILGLFRRLSGRLGRPAYAGYMPRTRLLLRRAARAPGLAAIRPLVDEAVALSEGWEAQVA